LLQFLNIHLCLIRHRIDTRFVDKPTFQSTKAVFEGDASFGQVLEPDFQFFLTLQKQGDVVLEQVKLPLEVDPASEYQTCQKHKLNYNRKVDLFVEVPGFGVVVSVHFYTGA
jgi:hypothetical protein